MLGCLKKARSQQSGDLETQADFLEEGQGRAGLGKMMGAVVEKGERCLFLGGKSREGFRDDGDPEDGQVGCRCHSCRSGSGRVAMSTGDRPCGCPW